MAHIAPSTTSTNHHTRIQAQPTANTRANLNEPDSLFWSIDKYVNRPSRPIWVGMGPGRSRRVSSTQKSNMLRHLVVVVVVNVKKTSLLACQSVRSEPQLLQLLQLPKFGWNRSFIMQQSQIAGTIERQMESWCRREGKIGKKKKKVKRKK